MKYTLFMNFLVLCTLTQNIFSNPHPDPEDSQDIIERGLANLETMPCDVSGCTFEVKRKFFGIHFPPYLRNKDKSYGFNIIQQNKDLEKYRRSQLTNSNERRNSAITYFHSPTTLGERAVVFLHGSEGNPFINSNLLRPKQVDSELIRLFTSNGFDYFGLERYADPFSTEASENTSFSQQEEYPISHEIIKIHQFCQRLVGSGYQDIILIGDSIGAILTLHCATARNAKMFNNIQQSGKTGGVRGYIALSGLPVGLGKLTSTVPIRILQGVHDTYCNYSLMKA